MAPRIHNFMEGVKESQKHAALLGKTRLSEIISKVGSLILTVQNDKLLDCVPSSIISRTIQFTSLDMGATCARRGFNEKLTPLLK